MKNIKTLTLGAISLVGLTAACSVEMGNPQEEVATNSEAVVCSNDQATFAIMAGMAVAAAKEMKRWLPGRDFQCIADRPEDVGVDLVGNNGAPDGIVDVPGKCIRLDSATNKQWKMGLSPKAYPRCPNRVCGNMSYLLSMQDDSNNGLVFGGQSLNAGVLRSRLYSYWQRQFTCINRPDNGSGDDCPVEYHDLSYWYKTTSSATCDMGFDFWFHSSKQGSNPPVALAKPAQLHNMLIWAGGTDNQFLQFNNVNGDVKIDPTGGTVPGSTVTSGSCYQVSYNASTGTCGRVVTDPSTNPDGSLVDPYWNVAGQCCKCGTSNKTLVTSSQVGVFKCQ